MIDSPRGLDPEGKKSCGVSLNISLSEYFKVLKELNPGAKTVHAYYSSNDSQHLLGEGEYTDLRHGVYFKKFRTSRSGFKSALQKQPRPDAIYIAADPLYDRENFEFLSKYGKDNKIILMAGFSSLVRAGATFAITADYGRLGAQTGEMANRLLHGSSCSSEGVKFADQTAFYLNEKYARASGFSVPEGLQRRARLTGLFNAGISLFREKRLKSAKIVFEKILSQDPSNEVARLYRARVVEELTGKRTGKLLASARDSFDKGLYDKAAADYRAILAIHENNRTAITGLRESLARLSEQQRARAGTLTRAGDPFGAIRMLQLSLDTNPTNDKSSAELAALRTQQSRQLPDLLAQGEAHYNARRYSEAISIFENILLIQPAHKEALEYLRLSQKKRAAIQQLLQGR
jgi:tetratricopeptide (TPR) repeat protein